MTKQEIIQRCISAYSEAIEVCKELQLDEAKDWLGQRTLLDGVCLFSFYQLKKHLLFSEWVERNAITHDTYWTTPPYRCNTHPELMESLTTRLEILKRELLIND